MADDKMKWDFAVPPDVPEEERRHRWPTSWMSPEMREAFAREPVCLYCGGLLVGGTVHGPGRGEVKETDPHWCDVNGPRGVCRTAGCRMNEADLKARRGRLDLASPMPMVLPVRPLSIPQGDDLSKYVAPDGGPPVRYLLMYLRGETPAQPHDRSRRISCCEVIAHVPHCGDHGAGVRSERYDAYFCQPCDRWLEEKCGDANCWFCPRRPDRPSGVA